MKAFSIMNKGLRLVIISVLLLVGTTTVYGQSNDCSEQLVIESVSSTCGNNDGTITISYDTSNNNNGTDGVLLGQDCRYQAVVPELSCFDATRDATLADNIVGPNEIVSVSNVFHRGDLIIDGGTAIICGSIDLTNLTFKSGKLYVLAGLTVTNVLEATGVGERVVYAHGSTSFLSGDYEGSVYNYNSFRVQHNYIVPSYGEAYSQGDLWVYGTLTNNGVINNHSSQTATFSATSLVALHTEGVFTNNGVFNNYCSVDIRGGYIENGTRNDHDPTKLSTGGTSTNSQNVTCHYTWKKDGEVIAGGASGDVVTSINNLGVGTYEVVSNCSNGCTGSKMITFSSQQATIDINPIVTHVTSTSPCNGEINLANNLGTQYALDGTIGSLPFQNVCAGLHTLTVYTSATCSKTVNVQVNDNSTTCDIDLDVDQSSEVCEGNTNGYIHLNSNGKDHNYGDYLFPGCVTDVILPTEDYCASCTSPLTGNTATVNGGTICLGDGFNGEVNLIDGRLIICGSDVRITNLAYHRGEIIVMGKLDVDNVVQHYQIVGESNQAILKNFGELTVNNNLRFHGKVLNYANLHVKGNLIVQNVYGQFINNGVALVEGNAENNYKFENNGLLTVYKNLYQRDCRISFVNNCTIRLPKVANSEFVVHGVTAENNGGIYVSNHTQVNHNAVLHQGSGTLLETKDLKVNGTIQADGSNCSLVKVGGIAEIAWDANLTGELDVCGIPLADVYATAVGPDVSNSCSCNALEMHKNVNSTVSLPSTNLLSYVWADFPDNTTNKLDNIGPGTYTVTVSNGTCSKTFTYTINEKVNPLLLTMSSTNTSSMNFCDGTASVAVAGSSDFSVVWEGNSNANNLTLDPVCADTYNVRVTDRVTGCYRDDSVDVISDDCANFDFTLKKEDTECSLKATGSVEVDQITLGTAPYTYSWSNGVTLAKNDKLSVGEYVLTLSDAKGCVAHQKANIEPLSASCICSNQPTLTVDLQKTVICERTGCDGSFSTISIIGAGTSVTYLNSIVTTETSFTQLCEGVYEYKVIDSENCYAKEVVTITNQCDTSMLSCKEKGLSISMNVDDATCPDKANGAIYAQLLGNGLKQPFTIDWKHKDIKTSLYSQSGILQLYPGQEYTLTMTDGDGCSVTNSATVGSKDCTGDPVKCSDTYQFDFDASVVDADCKAKSNGSAFVITTITPDFSPIEYSWDGAVIPVPYKDKLGKGVYTFRALNPTDRCFGSTLVYVDEKGECLECDGYSAALQSVDEGGCSGDGVAAVDVIGGLAPYKVYVAGKLYTESLVKQIEIKNLIPGTHDIKIIDSNDCEVFVRVKIIGDGTTPLQLQLISSVGESCSGVGSDGELVVQGTGGSGGLSIVWDDVNSTSSTTLSNLSQGIYTVTLTDEVTGCSISDSYTLLGGKGSLQADFDVIAVSSATSCDGRAIVTPSGSFGPFTYDWNTPNGNGPVAKDLCAGYYDVKINDTKGCSETFSVFLPVSNDCNTIVDATVTKATCTDNTGSVALVLQHSAESATSCYEGSFESPENCDVCDEYLEGVVNISSQASTNGKKYCVKSGKTIVGTINLSSGTLVVCGKAENLVLKVANGANAYLNGNVSLVHYSGSGNLYNYGKLNLTDFLQGGEKLTNYGLLTMVGNPQLNNGGLITNRGQLQSVGQLTILGTLINEGVLKVNSLSVNNGATFENYCTVNVEANASVYEDYINKGYTNIIGNTTLSYGKNIFVHNGALFETNNFTTSGGVLNGVGNITGTIKVKGTGNLGWGTTVKGNLNTCGINPKDGVTIENSVTSINCNDKVSPCSVIWSDGTKGTSLSNVVAGVYTATVTCGTCDGVTYTYDLRPSTDFTVTLPSNEIKLCGGSQTDIDITVTGGTAPYTYLWTGPNVLTTQEDQLNVGSGVYTVVVTDASGCSTAIKTINVVSSPAIQVSTTTTPTCNNKAFGTATVYATGGAGTNNYVYKWFNANGDVIGNDKTAIKLEEGLYKVVVTDHNGCSATKMDVEVFKDANKTCIDGCENFFATLEVTGVSCQGKDDATGHVTVVGGSTNLSYSWTTSQGTYLGEENSLPEGDVSVVVTDNTPVAGTNDKFCSATASDKVPFNTKVCKNEICDIKGTLDAFSVSCPGDADGSIELTVENSNSYELEWSHLSEGETITKSGAIYEDVDLPEGYYSVTIIDKEVENCQTTVSNFISQPSLLSINTFSTEICPDRPITLRSNYTVGNNWYDDSNQLISSDQTVVIKTGGLYTLENNSLQCGLVVDITITDNPECADSNILCNPSVVPDLVVDDQCARDLVLTSSFNAKHQFTVYKDRLKAEFKRQYIAKALETAEKFTVKYEDAEYHRTLYYYDQAGNLERTVPPEGVKLITDEEDLAQVKLDRQNGTRSVYTEHTYTTNYNYNSLNQLTGQLLPDHDAMEISETDESVKGGLPANFTVNSIELDGEGKGFLTGVTSTNIPKIYRTEDGGKTWVVQSEIGIMNLYAVDVVNNTTIYAGGDKGTFTKSTDDGENWTIHPVGTTESIRFINFEDVSNGTLYTITGKRWSTQNGGGEWFGSTGLSLPSGQKLTSMDFQGDVIYAAASKLGKGFVYKSIDNGLTWTNSSLLGTVVTPNLTAISYTTDNENIAYAAGEDGRLLKSIDKGLTWQMIPTNITGTLTALNFRDENRGVGLIANTLHVTFDGGKTWKPQEYLQEGKVSSYRIKNEKDGIIKYTPTLQNSTTTTKVFLTTSGGLTSDEITLPTTITDLQTIDNSSSNSEEFLAVATTTNGTEVFHKIGEGWSSIKTYEVAGQPITVIDALLFSEDKAVLMNQAGVILSSANLREKDNVDTEDVVEGPTFTAVTVTGLSNSGFEEFLYLAEQPYARKGNSLYTTTDEGETWTLAKTLAISTNAKGISATSTGEFLAVGDANQIDYTDNTLTSWSARETEISVLPVNDVAQSGNNVYVVGNNGQLLVSNNGGTSWSLKATGERRDLRAVHTVGSGVIAVGDEGATQASLSLLGTNWNKVSPVTTDDLFDVDDAGGRTITVGANGVVLIDGTDDSNSDFKGQLNAVSGTADIAIAVGTGGKIFKKTATANWECVTDMEALNLKATTMLSGGVGYGVGSNGTVVKTTDKGQNWDNQNATITDDLCGIDFVNNDKGVAIGANGTIIRTTNGGVDHFAASVTKPNVTNDLHDIQFVTSTRGFVVGNGGTILTTTNAGEDWTTISGVSSTINLKAVHFVDEKIGFVVGTNGTVKQLTKTATGYDVTEANNNGIPASSSLNDIHFVDYKTGYVVGDGGVFYKTINGGQAWESQNSDNPTTANFALLNFSDRNNFYIAGNNGALSKVKDEKDTYSVKFWYDQLGRIIAKQDARQYKFDGFSYTVYDAYNRIIEAGEVLNTTESITKYAKANISSQVPYTKYLEWLETGTKRQVSETKYDFQVKDFADYDNFQQENLRPRVATTLYREEMYADGHYDFASHYSYDEHGNVKTLITENTHLAHLNEQYKRIDYDYDLISGNVLQVAYQEGDADQFFHKYTYDEDNRLVDVFTSTNGAVWDKDCENQYYRHGALKRMEIGQEKVQALDYAYTIHGWLKAVNSETAESSRDIGQDGIANGFAKDEMGFSLKYYNGDYKAINSPTQGAVLNDQSLYTQLQNSANLSSGHANNLYNGNIMAMTTSINKFGASGTQTMAYNYDQLNRITDAQAYYYTQSQSPNQPTSVGTWASTDDYKTGYMYDANGNLKTLTRNGVQKTGQQRAMDNFIYHYEDLEESKLQGNNKFKRETNRLSYVTDDVTASNYDDDIDGHQIDNYSYDGIGNLTKDVDEQIEEIVWHVNGKVKEVKRTVGSEKSDVEFFYDAMGNRTIKLEKPRNGSGLQSQDNWVYTYYSRDAQGNVMGIYKRTYEAKPQGVYEETLKLEEQSIFGSSRAGLYNPDLTVATRNFTATLNAVDKTLINQTEISVENIPRYTNLTSHYLGKKSYELSNHLGNVLVVVSDRVDAQNSGQLVTGYSAVVVSANDYYPFGSPMPERSFSSPSYRYGFNGMEKDDEVKGSSGTSYDFGARMYDSRLGRFMSRDPLAQHFPSITPYAFAENLVIAAIDGNGENKVIMIGSRTVSNAISLIVHSDLSYAEQKQQIMDIIIYWQGKDLTKAQSEHLQFIDKDNHVFSNVITTVSDDGVDDGLITIYGLHGANNKNAGQKRFLGAYAMLDATSPDGSFINQFIYDGAGVSLTAAEGTLIVRGASTGSKIAGNAGGALGVLKMADDSYNKGQVSTYDVIATGLFVAGTGCQVFLGAGTVAGTVFYVFGGVVMAAGMLDEYLSESPDVIETKEYLPYKEEEGLVKGAEPNKEEVTKDKKSKSKKNKKNKKSKTKYNGSGSRGKNKQG